MKKICANAVFKDILIARWFLRQDARWLQGGNSAYLNIKMKNNV